MKRNCLSQRPKPTGTSQTASRRRQAASAGGGTADSLRSLYGSMVTPRQVGRAIPGHRLPRRDGSDHVRWVLAPREPAWRPRRVPIQRNQTLRRSSTFSDAQRFEDLVVRVAESPLLARLERSDHGMLRAVETLGGVLVLGRVAAPHMPAAHAEPQDHPGIAHLQALL